MCPRTRLHPVRPEGIFFERSRCSGPNRNNVIVVDAGVHVDERFGSSMKIKIHESFNFPGVVVNKICLQTIYRVHNARGSRQNPKRPSAERHLSGIASFFKTWVFFLSVTTSQNANVFQFEKAVSKRVCWTSYLINFYSSIIKYTTVNNTSD